MPQNHGIARQSPGVRFAGVELVTDKWQPKQEQQRHHHLRFQRYEHYYEFVDASLGDLI